MVDKLDKDKYLNHLVGQVMKDLDGRADSAVIRRIFEELLETTFNENLKTDSLTDT